MLLNISPKADGTIPDEQQQTLLAVGKWLKVNGDAIYGSRPWTQFSETAAAGAGGRPQNYRFTTQGPVLYATALGWPGPQAMLPSLASGRTPGGKVQTVTLLGHPGKLAFTQDASGLKVTLPDNPVGDFAYTLKIV